MSLPLRAGAHQVRPGSPDPGGPRTVRWTYLGRRPYRRVLAWQRQLAAQLAAGRGPDRLLLCEHEPVVTLGRRAGSADLVLSPEDLRARQLDLVEVERGGAATYHGPGQLVAYPILNLNRHRRDLRWLSRTLAACGLDTLAHWGIDAELRDGAALGLWTAAGKIAAQGLRVSSWVSYHGLALNVSLDLTPFRWIVPCAMPGATVDRMEDHLTTAPPVAEVARIFAAAFGRRFGVDMVEARRPAFARRWSEDAA